MCGVDNYCINAGFNKCINTIHAITGNTYTGSNTKATKGIFTCVGFIFSFSNVFISNQANQVVFTIHNRKFFNLVLLKNFGCFFKISRLVGCHEIFRCHHIVDKTIEVVFKTQIAVCNNTHKFIVIINHRNTTDMILFHHSKCITYSASTFDCYRIVNHTVFGTFHCMHLTSLLCYRHIFVNNTDTSFASNSNS